MKGRTIIRTALALAALALLPHVAAGQQAPKPGVDVGAFVKEIMAVRLEGGQQHLVMWMPYEFFVAATAANFSAPREAIERELAFLKAYNTLFVMASAERPDGTSVYASEADLRKRAALRLADGTELRPLDTVSPKLTAILAAMKAVMAQQGGADRENIHILVFPAATAAGKPVVDVSRKDSLNLLLKADARFREVAFTWRTPFDALAGVPDCPRCKAGVSAKWTYCPYCGQKLPH
jgi:hypothetical protein